LEGNVEKPMLTIDGTTLMPTESILLDAIRTPYDDVFVSTDNLIQLYMDIIRIRIAYSLNIISHIELLNAFNSLKQKPMSHLFLDYLEAPSRYSYPKETILEIVNNFHLASKIEQPNLHHFINAKDEALRNHVECSLPVDLEHKLFCYLVHNPLATYTQIARDLQIGRGKTRRCYATLVEHNSIRPMALLDRSAYGIETILFLFKIKDDIDWDWLNAALLQFPFTMVVHKPSLSETGYASFAIPGKKKTVQRFKSNLHDAATSLFDSFSIQHQHEIGKHSCPTLIQNGSWQLPACVESGEYYVSEIIGGHTARLKHNGYRSGMRLSDFRIHDVGRRYLNGTLEETRVALTHLGWHYSSSKISRSLRLGFERTVLVPILFFRARLHYNISYNFTCNREWRKRLFYISSHFPEVFYSISDCGAMIMLEAPMNHLVDYHTYFTGLTEEDGVENVRVIMNHWRPSTRSPIEIYQHYEYGKRGYINASDDIEISEHLL